MNSPIRHLVTLGAVTLAIVSGATFFVLARDGSLSMPDICTTTESAVIEETPFLTENEAAMKKMMSDMAVKPTGDVDVDFVAMMVPHHHGAIEMAQAELRYGSNERLRRMAQEIIITQLQEITAMRLSLGQALRPPVASPDLTPPAAMNDSKSATLAKER